MRPHKESKVSDEVMLKRLSMLPEEKQEHFRMVLRLIADCYNKENPSSAVLMVKNSVNIALVSINANDINIAEILSEASKIADSLILEDAPPREMFN